jgi:hypothetical protein
VTSVARFEPGSWRAHRWTDAPKSGTLPKPMVPRSAYADIAMMPAAAGWTAFAWSTGRVLVNVQPTGA